MSNTFFVHLPSNSDDYADNAPNKFRVRLPRTLNFSGGSWVCGLHSIEFAYSWPLLGTLDEQSINIHFSVDHDGRKQKVIHVPVPKASHHQVEHLRDFLAATLRHQSASIESIGKSDYTFVGAPNLSSPPSGRKRRSLSSPPTEEEPPLRSPSPLNEDGGEVVPAAQEEDNDPVRKKAKLLGDIIQLSLIADALPIEKPRTRNIIDEIVGTKPGKGEKSRAGALLEKMGVGAREPKTVVAPPPPAIVPTPSPAQPVTQPAPRKPPPPPLPSEKPKQQVPETSKQQAPKPQQQQQQQLKPLAPPPRSDPIDVVHGSARKEGEQKTRADAVLDKIGLGRREEAPKPATAPSTPPVPPPLNEAAAPAPHGSSSNNIIDRLFGRRVEQRTEKPSSSRAEQFLTILLGDEDEEKPDEWKSAAALERLRQIIDGVELQYHRDFDRFKVVLKDARVEFVSFSAQLGYMLGFDNPQRVLNNEVAKYSPDLRGGVSSFAVYTKGLTEKMIIGNSLSSLLRVVSVTGAVPGEYTEKIYDSPIYVRVLPKEVSEIELELRTLDGGRLVPFSYGTVMVILVFKKVINF